VLEPKYVHVSTALSGEVTFSVEPTTCVVTPDEAVRFPSMTGNAQRGAGNVASGPATKAVKSNFRREKLLFSLLFMG
jgi:hypothetical protein